MIFKNIKFKNVFKIFEFEQICHSNYAVNEKKHVYNKCGGCVCNDKIRCKYFLRKINKYTHYRNRVMKRKRKTQIHAVRVKKKRKKNGKNLPKSQEIILCI